MDPTAQQILDAVSAHNYALAVVLALIISVSLVRKLAPMIHGGLGVFLNSKRGASLLVLVGGGAGALATALMAGQHLTPSLAIGAFMTAAAASGGWNIVRDILGLSSVPQSPAGTAVAPPTPPAPKSEAGRANTYTLAGLIIVVMAVFFAFFCTGCMTAMEHAQLTRGATARSFDETTRAWLRYDAMHQKEIVDQAVAANQDPNAKLVEYRTGMQAKVVKGLKTMGEAFRALADALDGTEAATRKDWAQLAGAAIKAAADMVGILKMYNINIPLPKVSIYFPVALKPADLYAALMTSSRGQTAPNTSKEDVSVDVVTAATASITNDGGAR